MRRWLRWAAIAAAVAVAAAFVALLLLSCGCGGNSILTAARFSALRSDHTAMRAFLGRMPKGADLHVHLSGAVYAEDLIAWSVDSGLCFQLADRTIIAPPCFAGKAPPVADALKKQGFYDDIVNALSMRNFIPSADTPSGHDQFFSTFDKFGDATWRVPAAMTATLLRRYAAEQVQHTELMITLTPQRPALTDALLEKVKRTSDPAARLDLLKDYIKAAVPNAQKNIDAWQASINGILNCKTATADPGCDVGYRFIAQVNRNSTEEKVFAYTALAAALVRADPRVAGLNFVGPEDYRVAREDYHAHMKTIGFLTKKTNDAAEVPVALHAGELWLGIAPPDDLAFHIREAVDVAGARRIGHGVSLAYERRSDEVLAAMRKKPVVIEINLTSNDVILGVRGKDHPLPAYQAAGVPLVLSTDDAGVSRIDLTNEYFRAARDYGLGYRALKAMARNSLTYSFLADKDKRAALERFDTSAAAFERNVADERSVFGNMATLIAAPFR
jgi:adenosine deaminase